MLDEEKFNQNREFPRITFHKTPWVFSVLLPTDKSVEHPLRIEAHDISIGGIRFNSNLRFSVFTMIKIKLLNRQDPKKTHLLNCKVVRVDETDIGLKEKTYSIATQFEDISDQSLEEISKILISIQ